MCNASLLSGQLPVSQRHAIITPLLKKFGVPQESVLGSLLFRLCTAELFEISRRKWLLAHSYYVDYSQVYLIVPAAESVTAVLQFTECV